MTPSQVVMLVGVQETKANMKLAPGKTTLGRNVKDLNCTDKKVSREHAVIEVDEAGKVWLTATHVNPCFIHDSADSARPIKKGDKVNLKEGEMFSLLPTQYVYKVVYHESEEDESEEDEDEDEDEEEEPSEPSASESEDEESDYADSPKKKRGGGSKAGSTKKNERGRPARKAVKQPVKVDFINDDPEEDEDFDGDNQEDDDDDFEPSSGSDWEAEKRKKGSKKKRQPSSDEDDSDEDWGKPKKRTKAAPAKKPRPSSARRQPSRGTSSHKYRESDDSDY